jgi:hypothetical protein
VREVSSTASVLRCSICGAKTIEPTDLDLVPWWDCGGDCTVCMAHAGDPDAIRGLRKWLSEMKRDL